MGKTGNPARRAAEEQTRARGGNRDRLARATFYCDESGNTGVHWGDPDQPVFVHGGWMIPTSHQDALLTELTLIRQRYRLNAPELKWQQLARRANGSAVFRAIFEVMLANAAIPFFHVMDKDYILAAKAVETFFDPAYNHFLPMGFTLAYDIKKDLASIFRRAGSCRCRGWDLRPGGLIVAGGYDDGPRGDAVAGCPGRQGPSGSGRRGWPAVSRPGPVGPAVCRWRLRRALTSGAGPRRGSGCGGICAPGWPGS